MWCLQVLLFCVPLTIGCVAATVASPALETTPMLAGGILAPSVKPVVHEVIASWYGPGFAGRLTTSGERFNPRRLSAASVIVPLGSVVKVENPTNGWSVRVRITDCGPHVPGRTLDLSRRAAQKIGIAHQGIARLRVTAIKIPRNADADRCLK
jgi:rare lipoprotein A (peptidoglycan hydrolase)